VCVGDEQKDITFLSFAWFCLIQAVTGSWERADSFSILVGLVLGAIAYFIPAVEAKVTRLLLIVPLTSLASVTLFRLSLSPFLVYRKRDTDARDTEAILRKTLAQREEEIRTLTEKPKRSAAEQHNYDKLKKALETLREDGLVALRYITNVRSITFGGPYSPTLPSGLTHDKALWVYRHCASEGLLNCTPNLGKTQVVFTVPDKMDKIFDEVLFPSSS
jgi:hypothetical protein